MTLRGPEVPHLRALPEARVPKYATPLRAHEPGTPQARSLFRPTLQLGRLLAQRPSAGFASLRCGNGRLVSLGLWRCCRLVFGLRPANIASFRRWGTFLIGCQLVLLLQALRLASAMVGFWAWWLAVLHGSLSGLRPTSHRFAFAMGDSPSWGFVCGSLFVVEALFLLCGF